MPESVRKTSLGKSGISVGPVITGLWQIADQEREGRHFDLDRAAEELADYARSGFDTFDMADHYGSAEIVAGRAARILEAEGRPAPTILTKWCPAPGTMDRATVRKGVETALERLGRERVDVMQFHWWRYESPEYLDALAHLTELRDEGLIGAIGLTNFDAAHLGIVLAQGIPVTSNQVCLSLLDRRACGDLADVAEANGVRLLAFGTLLGGFLSRRWLGAGEPADIPDWSRMKYKRFIDTAGGWSRYQGLLDTLDRIAEKHGVSIPNVATAWVLGQRAVASVIVGVRLGENDHRDNNRSIPGVVLDGEDIARINVATGELDPIPGDCGDEYRRPPFLTASGDLSHHLGALLPLFPTRRIGDRQIVESGSVWEDKAGFARAVLRNGRILVSGTTATDPHGKAVAQDDAGAQAAYILDRITAALDVLGGRPDDVVRTRIYVADPDDWQTVSSVHRRYFGEIRPANTLVAARLIGPYRVEIEAEAELPASARQTATLPGPAAAIPDHQT